MEKDSFISSRQVSGKRKKKHHIKIKDQMEFYFSDSNIVKDQFLQNLLSKSNDGYVELKVFATFNKIKSLTEDTDTIAEALCKSSFLQVSEDRASVRRREPELAPKDYDECTLYVERLPGNADRDSLRAIFEPFGRISYVNVPHFRNSPRAKGFAFVEFECAQSVTKACEFYKVNSKKRTADSEEENIYCGKSKRNGADDRKSKKEHTLSKSLQINASAGKDNSDSKTHMSATDSEPGKASASKKRKYVCSESEGGENAKKLKLPENADSENQTLAQQNDMHRQKQQIQVSKERFSFEKEEHLSAPEACGTAKDDFSMKKHSKRKLKICHSSEKPTIRVMPKSEWKCYRNKYLCLQRATMSLIKQRILREFRERDFEQQKQSKRVEFESGLILRIALTQPLEDLLQFKEKVRSRVSVAYVDANVGKSEAHIRCLSPDEAKVIVKEGKLSDFGSAVLIKGSEEEEYWKKIEVDRKLKYSAPNTYKKRGREKIMAKVNKLSEQKNKHIFFED